MKTEDIAEEVIQNTADLTSAIKRLERRRIVMEDDLQQKFHEVLDAFRPVNILKATLHEVRESVPLRQNLLKVVLGLGAGYFSRRLIVGKSAGVIKKALGTVLQFGITHFVASKDVNPEDEDNVPSKKKNILSRILSI